MRKSVALCLTLMIASIVAGCGPAAGPGGAPSIAPSFPALNASDFASGQAFGVLPPGDVLMTVDAGTLINQTIPTMLANNPEQKAKFDQELQEMQAQYGVDPKQIKLMALTSTIPQGSEKPTFAAVLTGTFDEAKLKAALAKDPKTGAEARMETHGDTQIYVKTATAGGQSEETAVAVLDASTVVMGSPAAVRGAIDARAGKAPNATSKAELLETFRSTKETGLLRFAAAIPPGAAGQGTDQMTQALSAARYAFGSIDATSGLALDVTMRADTAEAAKPLYDQLAQGLEQVKPMVAQNQQLQGFKTILDSTTVTQAERDVKVAVTLTPIALIMLYEQFQSMSAGDSTPPPPAASNMNTNAAG
jgi:hypothetical protein